MRSAQSFSRYLYTYKIPAFDARPTACRATNDNTNSRCLGLLHPSNCIWYCDERVRMSVSPPAYLKNQMFSLHQMFALHMWPWLDPPLTTMRCVLPVLWMTSHFHIMVMHIRICCPVGWRSKWRTKGSIRDEVWCLPLPGSCIAAVTAGTRS